MSTTDNTYEAGLIAAMHALDALAGKHRDVLISMNPTTGDKFEYGNVNGRYQGALDALAVIAGMVSDYRYRKASA